ncbi:hypothetical protein CQ13_04150 [Bradyrhizobium retamae]|uniref:Uncharacterized protein n=1 Tax=Bradyrhizobium retamae TaxID=1300035 RepID=A0A0R3NCH5_9BRAD|nr:hypothetical protein CQ13_04150 [Bradyrhizobium retamae]
MKGGDTGPTRSKPSTGGSRQGLAPFFHDAMILFVDGGREAIGASSARASALFADLASACRRAMTSSNAFSKVALPTTWHVPT